MFLRKNPRWLRILVGGTILSMLVWVAVGWGLGIGLKMNSWSAAQLATLAWGGCLSVTLLAAAADAGMLQKLGEKMDMED